MIDKLSLVATPGQTVAIVGPTGAGKTTLVNLLMRFYDLDGGRILLDGVDLAALPTSRRARPDRHGAAGHLAVRRHDPRQPRATATPTATDDDPARRGEGNLRRPIRPRIAGRLRNRDRRGSSNLSAGEKQLITIARAFLADPAILVLDEATSSVDTRTEVLVQRAMATLRERRTSFVIAHRLSTIRDADIILVMEQGRIVEQGNHAELLARRGAYHALYHAQFAAPAAA